MYMEIHIIDFDEYLEIVFTHYIICMIIRKYILT